MAEAKARREKIEELRRRKLALENLLKMDGWKELERTFEEQIRCRRIQSFSSRLRSLDDAFVEADAKGEIAGITLAKALPQVLLGDLEADILINLELERQEQEEEQEKETD